MENMKKAALAILMIIACVFVFASCDTKDDVTYYQETVVGKYGDGISMTGTVTPETDPTEYVDVPRVEKTVYFDTRLEGWHFAGVFVVKGEKITITVPEDKADGSLTATVGRYALGSYSVKLDKPTVTFVSTVSGLLDVNLGSCYGDDFWQMKVSGGIAASYYRLGLDRVAEWQDSAGYAVVDATNARIYLPAKYIDSSKDVDKAAAWWRSLCEYADRYAVGVFGEDKLAPTDIFVVNYALSPQYNAQKDVLLVPASYAETMLDYGALTEGAAWEIMLALCKGKAQYASFDSASLSETAQILAAGAFVTLTNGILTEKSGKEYWINNPYDCLKLTLEGGLERYGDLAAYVNLIHAFGESKVVKTAVSYALRKSVQTDVSSKTEKADVSLSQYFCDSFAEDGIDLSEYFNNVCSFSVSETKEGLTPYVPLQSLYTLGYLTDDKTGITVNSGEKTAFDFAGSAISSATEVKLVKVMLGDKEWKANPDGLYDYKPEASVKTQEFTLLYEVGGQTVELKGRFTCNIAVSVFTRYENVPWRDMKSAVKEYSENGAQYLADERAVYKAEIPQNAEVDDAVYTFSVNKGAIQVDETATYVIYVRSKGMTRVDFGVPEYMFTMFENTLTVTEYTDLLCYEIELQKGVSYYYDIYILATKGNAYACLGISKKGETEIKDIDDSLLVYHPFDREDIAEYSAPALVPESFGVVKEGKRNYADTGAVLTLYPQPASGSVPASATDGNDDTFFTSKEETEHIYLFEFKEIFESDYITVKTGSVGVNYKLEYSVDGENFVIGATGVSSKSIEVAFPKAKEVRYVRLTLSSDKPFASVIKDVYCGVYANEATIVPSNSSRVLYQGKWQYKTGGISVNGWILESYGDDAAIEFNFYGTGISVYCAKGDVYGSMQIYVDGKQYGSVELNNATTLYNCNVFSVEFGSPGKHKIRIVPSSNDDIINLDYFTVMYAEQSEATPEVGNLWYFAIIPAALLAIFAVCIALDIADRRSKRRKLAEKSGRISSNDETRDSEDNG